MDKKHYNYLDIAKGIAIFAVVLGHCFPQNLYINSKGVQFTIAKIIYDFCYTWHMPVFFFISGFLFYNSWKNHDNTKIFTKAKRLLIPYLTFSVIYIPLRILMSNIANSKYSGYWKIAIGISPNGGVWYLYVLFLFMTISLFFLKNYYLLFFSCVIGIILNILSHSGLQVDYSVLRYTCIYYVFFGVGLLWREKLENIIKFRYNFLIVIVQIIVFISLFCIQELYGFESFNVISGFIGINIVFLLSNYLEKNNQGKMIQQLGNISMSIYLLHGPILVVLRTILMKVGTPPLVSSAIMLIGGILLSVIIDKYLLHINHIIEFIFLGVDCNNSRNKEAV